MRRRTTGRCSIGQYVALAQAEAEAHREAHADRQANAYIHAER